MSLGYNIEYKIQWLEKLKYYSDLNSIENLWAIIKYKLGGNAYKRSSL